jgi:hypothetical protein
MIQAKKKICDGCGLESYIWKSKGGVKLCKQCSTNTGVAKLSIKPTAKKKPIPPRSQKRSKEERLYSGKRIIFLQEHPLCEAHLSGICTKYSTECHHKRGRIGDDLLDETLWLALCHNCHEYIENHREFAMEKGFSIKRIN